MLGISRTSFGIRVIPLAVSAFASANGKLRAGRSKKPPYNVHDVHQQFAFTSIGVNVALFLMFTTYTPQPMADKVNNPMAPQKTSLQVHQVHLCL
jgi:hypothetical protein